MLPLQEDVIASFDLAENNPTVAAYVGGGNTSVGVAYTYDVKKKTSALLANPMKPVLDKIDGYNERMELYVRGRYGN